MGCFLRAIHGQARKWRAKVQEQRRRKAAEEEAKKKRELEEACLPPNALVPPYYPFSLRRYQRAHLSAACLLFVRAWHTSAPVRRSSESRYRSELPLVPKQLPGAKQLVVLSLKATPNPFECPDPLNTEATAGRYCAVLLIY